MANVIEIVLKAKNMAGEAFREVNAQFSVLENNASHAGRAIDVAFGQVMYDAIQGVANALEGLGKAAITNFIDAEKAALDFAVALENAGSGAATTAEHAEDLAKAIQDVTRFEDDAVMAAQATLLSFRNLSEDAFDRAAWSAANLAEKLQIDLPSAARIVGMALEDPTKAARLLRQANIILTDEQTALIKKFAETGEAAKAQEYILGLLEDRYGGLAETAGKSFGGMLDRVSVAWGNFLEAIGKAMGENENFQKLLENIIDLLEKMTDAFLNMPEGVQTTIVALGGVLTLIGKLGPSMLGLAGIMQVLKGASFGGLGTAIAGAGAKLGGLVSGIVAALGPIGLLIVAIGALIAVVIKFGDEAWLAAQQLGMIGGAVIQRALDEAKKSVSLGGKLIAAEFQVTANESNSALESIRVKLGELGSKLIEAASQIWEVHAAFIAFIGEENQKMMQAFAEQLIALGQRFSEFGVYVVRGLQSAYTALTRYISQLIRSIRNWASNIGRSFIYGIGDGINAAWSWLIDVIRNLAASILETARAALQAGSPSMLAAEMIGVPIAQGIGLGIQMGMQDVNAGLTRSLTALPAASNIERSRLGATAAIGARETISVGHIEYHGAFSQDELKRLDNQSRRRAGDLIVEVLG